MKDRPLCGYAVISGFSQLCLKQILTSGHETAFASQSFTRTDVWGRGLASLERVQYLSPVTPVLQDHSQTVSRIAMMAERIPPALAPV